MSCEGKFILAARKRTRLTQRLVAKRLGISPQFLGHLEKGAVKMPLSLVKKFCKITGADAGRLITAKVFDFKMKCEKEIL